MQIRKLALTLASNLCGFSSLPALAQKGLQRHGITILCYHGITSVPLPFEDWCFLDAGRFRRQIAYLRNTFNIVPMATALDMLDHGSIRRPTVVITFDDGFQNNYDLAFPILQEFKAPATIFLVTDRIDTDRTLWFCRIHMAMEQTTLRSLSWKGHHFHLTTPAQKSQASAWLQNSFKDLPFQHLLHELAILQQTLGVDGKTPVPRNSPFRILDHESIRRMKDSGLIDFGGHTHTHAILSRLTPEEQSEQILLSKKGVKHFTKQPCRLFAYPNGARSDYDATTTRTLSKCGIVAAVNMAHGLNQQDTHRLHLRRYGIGADTGFPRFKLMVHGFT